MTGIGEVSAESAPAALLTAQPEDLLSLIGQPTLITIPGSSASASPLFVSTLLHGNEHSGFLAMQHLVSRYRAARRQPRRSLLWLIGNVKAAAQNKRFLPGQPDYNRIWGTTPNDPHAPCAPAAELEMAKTCLEVARHQRIFAALDLHNNTGRNPHYACLAQIRKPDLHLARHFSRTILHFQKPETTFGAAFSLLAPAITVEAGLSGEAAGISATENLIESAWNAETLSEEPVDPSQFEVYRNEAAITLTEGFDLTFAPLSGREALAAQPKAPGAAHAPLGSVILRDDLDHLNFSEASEDTFLGVVTQRELDSFPFQSSHPDIPVTMTLRPDGKLFLARGSIPSMLTPQREAVLVDCLCYLMSRVSLDGLND